MTDYREAIERDQERRNQERRELEEIIRRMQRARYWSRIAIVAGVIALLAAVLVLTGCAKPSENLGASGEADPRVGSIYYNVPAANLYEFKTKDGVTCIYGYNVGISCGWAR